MATLVLSAAGAAIGAGFGGAVLGLSGAVIGRAIGATLGRAIDQRLLGAGADMAKVGAGATALLTDAVVDAVSVTRVAYQSDAAGQRLARAAARSLDQVVERLL